MLIFFLAGFIASLFIGGRTALNYWLVKISRGKKVLIFLKTKYGWESKVAKKEQDSITWKYLKEPQSSTIEVDSVYSYMRLDCVFIDADNPNVLIKLKDGAFFPDDFDYKTYNNILTRAITKPNTEQEEDIKKLIIGILIIGVLCLLGIIQIYMKVSMFASSGVI